MIELTERQKNILQDLVNLSTPTPAKELAKKYNVSVRTVRYDIDAVEYLLKSNGYILMKKPHQGIWIEIKEKDKEFFKSVIGEQRASINRVLSKEERQYQIQLILLESNGPVTAEQLSTDLLVSRTTIMKDLNEIREEIKKYDIYLKSKPRIGYILAGEEKSIREYLANMLMRYNNKNELLQLLSKIEKSDSIQESRLNLASLNSLSDVIKIEDIKEAIKSGKSVMDFWIPDSSYVSLIVHISVAIDRLLKGQKIVIPKDRIEAVKDFKEYQIAMKIGKTLTDFYKVKITDSEIANITIHLLSADLKLRSLYEEELFNNHITLKQVVDEMVVSIRDYVNLDNNELIKLKEDILSHIRLTLKKYKLNIHYENPLLEQIKTKYFDSFELAKTMGSVFKELTNIELHEGEIGYIALHLAAHMEIIKKGKKKRALVVCTTGKGSAKVLAYRIENSISDIDIVDTLSVFDLEDKKTVIDDVDIVISTVGLVLSNKPVIKVSPLVDNSEINRIKEFLYKDSGEIYKNDAQRENYILNSIIGIAGKYVAASDISKLRTELGFLAEFITNNSTNKSMENIFYEQFSHRIALMLAEINEMVKEIERETNTIFKLDNLWGLIIHLIMAMPRWNSGVFNKEVNLDKYRKEYKELYPIVKKHLNNIAEKNDIRIPEGEVVAIIRYLV